MYRVAEWFRIGLISGGVAPWFLRVLAVASLVLAILVLNGNLTTGFTGKTLWQWMDVFGMPVVVVTAAGLFGLAAQRANQRAQDERELAADRAGGAILQGYLQSMSHLLVEGNIRGGQQSSHKDSPVWSVVAAQTLAALRSLNGSRKGIVILFLHDSHLIRRGESTILLSWADLSGADLSGGDLSHSDLSGANMRDADLSKADLSGSDLTEAVLYGTDLGDADLTDAIVDDEQLALAASLVGATMPDGSEMTEDRWEEFRSEVA